MTKFYNEFDFIGELAIPNDDSQFLDVRDNGKGWMGHRLNFGVMETKYNSQFIELYGGYRTGAGAKNVAYAFSKGNKDTKGQKMEIPWNDRLNESIVDMVADFAKIVVDLETDFEKKSKYMELAYQIRNIEYENGDKDKLDKLKAEFNDLATNRHEFIHKYDAIQFLSQNLKNFKDNKFRVQGRPNLSEWDGKYWTNYHPQTIEIVPEDYKNQLKLKADIFFLPDSVDNTDDNKIYIEGYMQDYVSENRRDELFPKTFVINKERLDMENEQHVSLLEFLKNQFNTDKNHLYHLPWEINLYNGAEVIDSEEALTEQQKQSIELGLSSKEDYSTTMFGQNVQEYRLVKPILIKGFANGAVDTGNTKREAEELICQPGGDIKMDDVMGEVEKEEETDSNAKEVEDVMDSLFG